MGRKLVAVLALLGTVTLVSAGKAKILVRSEPDFDFSTYKTFGWTNGTPAVTPGIEDSITESVENELQQRGLTKTTKREADLIVATYAFGEMGMDVIGRSFWGAYGGVTRVDVGSYTKGSLWIKITEPQKEEPVWQSLVGKVVTGRTEKVVPKIPGIIAKMFKTAPTPPPKK